MTLLKQFQTITFHRVFVDITGSINAALMLSNAIYWTNRLPPERDGWFYKTKEEWEQETGLTREQQDKARRQLQECGLIETRRAKISDEGVTAIWFRIDQQTLSKRLDQLPESGNCQLPQTGKTNCRKPAIDSFYTSTTPSINNNKARAQEASPRKTPPPEPRPIPPDWQPSATALALLDAENIPAEFALSCLPEFRLYWSGRGDRRPDWNPAFLKQVRNQFTRQQEHAHDRSATRQGLSGRPASSRRETISERLERYERFIAGDDDDPGNAPHGQRGPISGEFIRH